MVLERGASFASTEAKFERRVRMLMVMRSRKWNAGVAGRGKKTIGSVRGEKRREMKRAKLVLTVISRVDWSVSAWRFVVEGWVTGIAEVVWIAVVKVRRSPS